MLELAVTVLSVRNRNHRAENEDAVSVFGFLAPAEADQPTRLTVPLDKSQLILVADGMGGHAAGGTASREVASVVHANRDGLTTEESIQDVLQQADARLLEVMDRRPETEGMGTTVAGIAVHKTRARLFNVGDSRIYGFIGDRLIQLSIDDRSNAAVAIGPSAGIQQFVGGGKPGRAVKVPNPHFREASLGAGDRFLICTDGISDYLRTPKMESLFRRNTSDRNLSLALVNEAYKHGSSDNMSVVLVEVKAVGECDELPQGERPDRSQLTACQEDGKTTVSGSAGRDDQQMTDRHDDSLPEESNASGSPPEGSNTIGPPSPSGSPVPIGPPSPSESPVPIGPPSPSESPVPIGPPPPSGSPLPTGPPPPSDLPLDLPDDRSNLGVSDSITNRLAYVFSRHRWTMLVVLVVAVIVAGVFISWL